MKYIKDYCRTQLLHLIVISLISKMKLLLNGTFSEERPSKTT